MRRPHGVSVCLRWKATQDIRRRRWHHSQIPLTIAPQCVCNIWIDVKLLLLSFFSPSNKGCNLQCRGCQRCTLDWHKRRRQCFICDIDGDAHRRTCFFTIYWNGKGLSREPQQQQYFRISTVAAIWAYFRCYSYMVHVVSSVMAKG